MDFSKEYIKKCEESIDLWSKDYIFRVGSLFYNNVWDHIVPIAWSGKFANKPPHLIPIWQADQLFEMIAAFKIKFRMQIVYEASNIILQLEDNRKIYSNITGHSLEEALLNAVNLLKDIFK